MNSFTKKVKKTKKKHDKKHKKDKKKRRSSSSSSSSGSSSSSSGSSDSGSDEKHKRKKHKKDHKKKTKDVKGLKVGESSKAITTPPGEDFSIPIHLMKNKAPETREEYEKRQSVIRRVVDPETGRTRLIKGDGEILEEIVTRDRHREINKLATQTDGQVYQNKTIGWAVSGDKK